MRHTAVIIALCVGPLFAAPVPKSVKRTSSSLDGAWVLVEWSYSGNLQPMRGTESWEIEDGYARVFRDGASRQTVELTRPDGAGANAVDYHALEFGVGGMPLDTPTSAGVFERDGDTLRLCCPIGDERPTECTPGAGKWFFLFKRVSDDKKAEQKGK